MKGDCAGQACGSVLIKLLKWHAWAAASRAMMSTGWTPISCERWKQPWVHISCLLFFVCFCHFFSLPSVHGDFLWVKHSVWNISPLTPLTLLLCAHIKRKVVSLTHWRSQKGFGLVTEATFTRKTRRHVVNLWGDGVRLSDCLTLAVSSWCVVAKTKNLGYSMTTSMTS